MATYFIYQVGQGDLLGRFLTGLGVAGLAASLAAQDALKSFFGTLLLIGEARRSRSATGSSSAGKKESSIKSASARPALRMPNGSVLTIPNSTIGDRAPSTTAAPRRPRGSGVE